MSHFQLHLAYLFPPVVAYRALMFVEFKGTLYNIHLWNRKGAEIVLTGDEILEYVDSCLSSDVQNGINPSVSLGSYILILTLWNIVMLLISYLYYQKICSDMNCHLKTRREQNRENWKRPKNEYQVRESSLSTVYGDIVHLNPAEDELLRSLVQYTFVCISSYAISKINKSIQHLYNVIFHDLHKSFRTKDATLFSSII